MSAVVISFPGVSPRRAALRSVSVEAPQMTSASSLATNFIDHFLPVVQASIDLLEADQHDFSPMARDA